MTNLKNRTLKKIPPVVKSYAFVSSLGKVSSNNLNIVNMDEKVTTVFCTWPFVLFWVPEKLTVLL